MTRTSKVRLTTPMATRLVRLGCEFIHTSVVPVSSVFQVEPRATMDPSINPGVRLRDETWSVPNNVELHPYVDLYGNRCQRMEIPEGESTISYSVVAEVPDEAEEVNLDAKQHSPRDLPDDVLLYTMPSRFCLPDELGAEAWRLFGDGPRGYARVQAIIDHIHERLTFKYGTSSSWSTARDVYESGYGVCRDYAHLAITFCRALNIPARYVFGYIPEIDITRDPAPMDFAAWMQVWLGDRWYTFDPRNNAERKGRVLIGIGRDASDVALVTSYGAPWLKQMIVVAREIQPGEENLPLVTDQDLSTQSA